MKKIVSPLCLFFGGLILGALSRIFDIYCQVLGDVFSQMAIWILLGTLIAIYSKTKVSAMINIFPFCIGMLVAYYAVAMATDGVYGTSFIIGWAVFALFSPVFAYFVWMSKEKGVFPVVIRIGVVGTSVMSSILLFDHLRFYEAQSQILWDLGFLS